jgi:hypothetical protein
VFHRLMQAKFAYCSSFSCSSQFSVLLQLPPKIKFASKMVKSDWEIIISISNISVKFTVFFVTIMSKDISLKLDQWFSTYFGSKQPLMDHAYLPKLFKSQGFDPCCIFLAPCFAIPELFSHGHTVE